MIEFKKMIFEYFLLHIITLLKLAGKGRIDLLPKYVLYLPDAMFCYTLIHLISQDGN